MSLFIPFLFLHTPSLGVFLVPYYSYELTIDERENSDLLKITSFGCMSFYLQSCRIVVLYCTVGPNVSYCNPFMLSFTVLCYVAHIACVSCTVWCCIVLYCTMLGCSVRDCIVSCHMGS